MILAPDVRGQQVVQGTDRAPPGDVVADFQPLGVLIEHRIDDVDEGLVAGEEAVPPGQQIAFQPALALVLAQHLHDAAIGGQMIVVRVGIGHPGAVGHLQHILPAVRVVLIWAEEAKVLGCQVQLHHVAEEPPHHASGLGTTAPGLGTGTA